MAADLAERIRYRFPIFRQQVYVNSCSQGALSDAVRSAYDDYLRDWDERGSPWGYWVEQADRARSAFARLVNARDEEIAVTTSLSAGVSALVSGLEPAERSTIVVSDFEFPTVGQIAHAQERRGMRVVHVPAADDGTIPLERFDAAIDERTALVAVAQVCYRNGARQDVDAIVRLAHERGAPVLVDAYQAIGAIPIDVRASGVDFLACGVLKYLLGSAGLGFLYCRSDLLVSIVPTQTGWFADDDIFEMDIHDYSPAASARRFEAGTPPVPSIYAGIAGMELMDEIGVAETEEHVRGLTERLLGGLDELGARVVTPRDPAARGPMTAIAASDEHALVAALAERDVVVSCRDGNLRVSPHCYNTRDDVDAVLDALARNRQLLA